MNGRGSRGHRTIAFNEKLLCESHRALCTSNRAQFARPKLREATMHASMAYGSVASSRNAHGSEKFEKHAAWCMLRAHNSQVCSGLRQGITTAKDASSLSRGDCRRMKRNSWLVHDRPLTGERGATVVRAWLAIPFRGRCQASPLPKLCSLGRVRTPASAHTHTPAGLTDMLPRTHAPAVTRTGTQAHLQAFTRHTPAFLPSPHAQVPPDQARWHARIQAGPNSATNSPILLSSP